MFQERKAERKVNYDLAVQIRIEQISRSYAKTYALQGTVLHMLSSYQDLH